MRNVARLPDSDRGELFRNTADKMGLNDAIVEKDFWVCFTLDHLFHRCPWKDAITFKGGERTLPNYNIMGVAKAALDAAIRYAAVDLGKQGVRVNGISAGPIKTLAASGIGDFRKILRWNELNAPLKRNVTQDEVGAAALALLSPLGAAITGEVLHVDAGYHSIGMVALDNAHESGQVLMDF